MQGWVQEMWGYTIAAASVGIKHRLVHELQVEASSLSHIGADFSQTAYIFHYTYGIEYTAAGRPQGVNQIGEWSLDKRHYGGDHPPRHLEPPPAGANAAAVWLLNAWNEASAGIVAWPKSKSMGTYGWRRQKASDAAYGDASSSAGKAVGTRWTWAGNAGFEFRPQGLLRTPWGDGTWGLVASKASGGDDVPEDGVIKCTDCLFADFANANHNLRFDFDASPPTFKSVRVGDMLEVKGEYLGRI